MDTRLSKRLVATVVRRGRRPSVIPSVVEGSRREARARFRGVSTQPEDGLRSLRFGRDDGRRREEKEGSRFSRLLPLFALAFALGIAAPGWAANPIFTAGTGISITTGAGTASRVVANTGVTSNIGTANQVAVSGATGVVTISLIGPYTPATYTAHGILLGEGTSSIVPTAVMTNGQVLVGSTGADPAPATLGCTGCSWTTGAGTLSLTIGNITVTNNPSCTSGYTVLSTDQYIRASAGAGADCTLNLPAASGNVGRLIYVKREDSNAHNVLVHPNGTDTIDGLNSNYTVSIQYEEFGFVVGATGAWDVI
jgi:hypothetical protein